MEAPYGGSYADVVFCVPHENDANSDCSGGPWLDPATEGVYYPTREDCFRASTGAWNLCVEDRSPLTWIVYCEEATSEDDVRSKSGGYFANGYYISQAECQKASVGIGST